MLAGRKLLLADDSITIQKVVALTFADEGIEVLAVSNGAEAIQKLEEFGPDVVLADVYMPEMTGLQVCDYIKRNEKLKHIPVMLLVGSFEPFDEAEARRVGAEDTLTKPFQSIRTLVDKVGVLLGREAARETPKPAPKTPEKVAPAPLPEPFAEMPASADMDSASALEGSETLEFPEPEEIHVPQPTMDTDQLELTTADTMRLSPEVRSHLHSPSKEEERPIAPSVEEQKMETPLTSNASPEHSEGFGDTILDLGDFEATPLSLSDDVILDIDFDSPAPEAFHAGSPVNGQSVVSVEEPSAPPALSHDKIAWTSSPEEVVEWQGEIQTNETGWATSSPVHQGAVETETSRDRLSEGTTAGQEASWSSVEAPPSPAAAAMPAPAAGSGQITLAQLSPEAIDAIARRVVEQLSEKVVQEIAWEVVPQLAELLINRKLEESK